MHREPPWNTQAATGRNWNESSHPGTGVEHLQTNGGYIPLWVRFTRGIQPGRLLGLTTPVPSRWQHRGLPGDAPGAFRTPPAGSLDAADRQDRLCLPGPAGGCTVCRGERNRADSRCLTVRSRPASSLPTASTGACRGMPPVPTGVSRNLPPQRGDTRQFSRVPLRSGTAGSPWVYRSLPGDAAGDPSGYTGHVGGCPSERKAGKT